MWTSGSKNSSSRKSGGGDKSDGIAAAAVVGCARKEDAVECQIDRSNAYGARFHRRRSFDLTGHGELVPAIGLETDWTVEHRP